MVTKLLRVFCDTRIPPPARRQIRLGFRVKSNEVVLFEERPTGIFWG